MKHKYGLDPDTWQHTKAEIHSILIGVARDRSLITYGEIATLLTRVTAHPGSYVFTAMLREVCRDEFAQTGLSLCALVVAKATGQPGSGYFRGMSCDGELLDCWQAECETVYQAYGEKQDL